MRRRWPSPLALILAVAVIASACSVADEVASEVVIGAAAPPEGLALATDDQDDGNGAESTDPTPSSSGSPTPSSSAFPVERLSLGISVADIVVDPAEADPTSPSQLQLLDLLYDGLLSWDVATMAWTPELATEVIESSDGLTWTFFLDETAMFSDGTALLASDVERSLEAVVADRSSLPALRLESIAGLGADSEGSGELGTVGIAAVSDHELQIVLRRRDTSIPVVLSSPIFGVTPPGRIDGSVGSGPYVLDEDHLDAISTGGLSDDAVGGVGEIELRSVGGDIVLESADSALATQHDTLVEVHYAMNVASPKLADVERRMLIASAVDQSAFTPLFDDGAFDQAAVPIDGLNPIAEPCSPSCGGFVGTATVAVPDVWVDYVVDESGREQAIAELLAAELRRSGIPAQRREHSLDEFVALVGRGEHEVYRTGWVGLAPHAHGQLVPYMTGSPDNVSGYGSAGFDGWMVLARHSGDPGHYAEAAAALATDHVVIPLVRITRSVFVAERVEGVALRGDGTFDVRAVSLVS